MLNGITNFAPCARVVHAFREIRKMETPKDKVIVVALAIFATFSTLRCLYWGHAVIMRKIVNYNAAQQHASIEKRIQELNVRAFPDLERVRIEIITSELRFYQRLMILKQKIALLTEHHAPTDDLACLEKGLDEVVKYSWKLSEKLESIERDGGKSTQEKTVQLVEAIVRSNLTQHYEPYISIMNRKQQAARQLEEWILDEDISLVIPKAAELNINVHLGSLFVETTSRPAKLMVLFDRLKDKVVEAFPQDKDHAKIVTKCEGIHVVLKRFDDKINGRAT